MEDGEKREAGEARKWWRERQEWSMWNICGTMYRKLYCMNKYGKGGDKVKSSENRV